MARIKDTVTQTLRFELQQFLAFIGYSCNSSIRVICVHVFVLVIVLFADAAYADSHKDLRDPAKCADCHLEKPQVLPSEICTSMNIPIKDTVTEMCTKCHEYGERSHPTDKAVDFPVPLDLPLKDKRITCVTCHYPHAKHESDNRYVSASLFGALFSREKKHKTYFLRRPNTNGELCMACHGK